MNEEKKELLQNAIEQIAEYGYISWDGLLDLCDEDMDLVNWLGEELVKLGHAEEVEFD